jgi:hypothetical protein
MSKVTKDLEDFVGKDKIDEIIEKDWKVTDLPSEEELASEKSESPKARNNPNSRKNLAQYNKRTKEQKKKSVQNLKVTEIQEDVDPYEIFGDSVKIDTIELMMPARSILVDRQEQLIYYNTIHLFLKDFSVDEISFSDLDDVITLALNRVLEQRLWQASRKSPKMILEASSAIEKFRKHSDKIKQNLASRRVDRIDLKNKPTMSIVELAAHLDAKKQLDFEARLEALKQEATDFVPPERDEMGLLIPAVEDN